MTQPTQRTLGDSSLIDLLDRLVETGVVATGDVLLGLADVDLIRVNLRLVLGAVDTLMADDNRPVAPWQPQQQIAQHGTAQHDTAQHGTAQHGTAQHGTAQRDTAQREPAARSQPATAAHDTPGPAPVTGTPPSLRLDSPDRSDLGIGGLLVAVIEIVHRLLERQAIHRMERGSLTNDQVERLGQALMALDQRINQLIEIFNPHSVPALPVTVAGAGH